ncbi:MAG: sensor histidine kinase [Nocardioides sp.]|uniref:sensor histidine kinase n=1 Tax=Nocardioides sp. TaxID=35761 RepID=UPI003F06D6C7
MNSESESGATGLVAQRTWRVATAVRVFALAMVLGTALSQDSLSESLPLIAALVVIASATSAMDMRPLAATSVLNPVAESLLVGVLIAMALDTTTLVAYLAVPPITAGLRHGWVTTLNTGLVGIAALAVTTLVSPVSGSDTFSTALPWQLVGIGVGMLATWQSRAVREAVMRQASDAEAHELVSQLHDLARRGDVGLDRNLVADELRAGLRDLTGADRIAVFVSSVQGACPELVSHSGDVTGFGDLAGTPEAERPASLVVLPLGGAQHSVGHVVLEAPQGWSSRVHGRASTLAREYGLRLDTADLFERVRLLATAEERNRIARDMHDGVAQEVVGLGYLVDEIGEVSTEPSVHALSATLREEITRVVTELRFSIFDLRHHVADTHLSGALSEYVRQLSTDCDFQVNLALDVSGAPLSPKAETQLLRIAQEAIGNVRKHARASEVWVSLASDGSSILFQVEDDGIGNAAPRELHWGLQSMQERAASLGATLEIHPREGGGTVVRLASGTHLPEVPHTEGALHGHHSPAGR